ncbi:MAG: hypothetical protein R3327_07385, partial [Nitrosopumilaceae archaeon]|nr:hypothetical protein [Nitrosopumilaceae archaeon]
MKKFLAIFLSLILVISITPMLFSDSFAESVSPRHQWKIVSDIDELTCNNGLILLQKFDSTPACVSPETYLKLVDRGYGMFDSSIMKNRPAMLNNLMKEMISTHSLIHHWHDMMLDNPSVLNHTMSNWVSQMKTNHDFLANVMAP